MVLAAALMEHVHMTARIEIAELRDTLTATIWRVRDGETLVVTHDGESVAILAPMPGGRLGGLVAGGDVPRRLRSRGRAAVVPRDRRAHHHRGDLGRPLLSPDMH